MINGTMRFIDAAPWTRQWWLGALGLWSGLLFCTLLALALRGYAFAVGDQNLYLPFLYHWNDPSLFPHDYLLTLPWARNSLTWPALAFLGRWLDYRVLFLFLHVAATFLTLGLVFQLAHQLWRNRDVAWLAVLLWLPSYEVPGSGTNTFDGYLTTRCLVSTLALAALVQFLRNRYGVMAFLLALGVLLHVITVLPLAGGIALALLLERRWRVLAAEVAALILAGAFLLAYSRFYGVRQDLFCCYTGIRYELLSYGFMDLFPQAWTASTWTGIALYGGALGLVFLLRHRAGGLAAEERRIYVVALGAILLAGLGMVGAYARLALVVQLSLVRGYYWVLLALTLWLVGVIGPWLASGQSGRIALGCFLLAGWMTGAVGSHALIVALLSAELLRERSPGEKDTNPIRWPAFAVLAVLLLLQAYWLKVLPPLGLNWVANGLPAGVIFAGMATLAAWATCRLGRKGLKSWHLGAALTVVLLLFPTDPMIHTSGMKPWLCSVVPSLRWAWRRELENQRQSGSRTALLAKIREVVPEEATVLVDPDWTDFRLQTMRSSFVTTKDECGLVYSEPFSREWVGRMIAIRALGQGGRDLDPSLDLTVPELIGLSQIYRSIHLDYVLTSRHHDLPEVASVGDLTLYRLVPEAREEGKAREGPRSRTGNNR